jgi:YebC/PmpR family DNA-binding regulatory protein
MPAENIERAIKKATGELEGTAFYEVTYEGYGPAGAALLVEAATDNKNRTVSEMRHIFTKYGGTLGEAHSVAWMFERKGIITVKRNSKSEDEMMEIILEAGADDLFTGDDYFEVKTTVEAFEPVRKFLAEQKLEIENASLQWIAKNKVSVAGEAAEKLVKLIEAIEDCDDVQNVYTNAEFPEDYSS